MRPHPTLKNYFGAYVGNLVNLGGQFSWVILGCEFFGGMGTDRADCMLLCVGFFVFKIKRKGISFYGGWRGYQSLGCQKLTLIL